MRLQLPIAKYELATMLEALDVYRRKIAANHRRKVRLGIIQPHVGCGGQHADCRLLTDRLKTEARRLGWME